MYFVRVTFRIVVGLAILLAFCGVLGVFGVNETTINYLPDLDINPKMTIAVGAVITASCFAVSDSQPTKKRSGRGPVATPSGNDTGWRDNFKLFTHGFAIVTAGWAVWFTSQGWL